MAITQAMATSFKVQLLNGQQNFSADTFKLALYTSSATLGENTTVYSATNEVPSTGNYSAGGNTLSVSVTPTNTGNVAFISFSNSSWANATITANGALIYNANVSNAAVCVLAFGGDKTSTNGTFAVNFPTADSTSAIIRLTAS
jgi:VCBS repeat-containing protein